MARQRVRRISLRGILILLAGVALGTPGTGRAQQPNVPVIGFLNSGSPEAFGSYVAAFHQALREGGYTEGENLAIEYRWAYGQHDRLPALAAELVVLDVAVIVATGGEPSALAAKAATDTIPIIFLIGGDPISLGLATSFNRPGGNSTGVSNLTVDLNPKRLELMREVMPDSEKFAVLLNPNFPDPDNRRKRVEEAALSMGLELTVFEAFSDEGIEAAFHAIALAQPDALLVSNDPFFNNRRDLIVTLAARIRVPAIYAWREYALAGGLMSYGTSLPGAYREVGFYAGRILGGAEPADLPILQPTTFEFVVNLRTAAALGMTMPPSTLVQATEIIE